MGFTALFFSLSSIRAAQLSMGGTSSSVAFVQTSSSAFPSSSSNSLNSACNARPSSRCSDVNWKRCGRTSRASSDQSYVSTRLTRYRLLTNLPRVVLNLPTNLVMDLRRYSSSSTVPFRPEPTFLSSFLLERELLLCSVNKTVSLHICIHVLGCSRNRTRRCSISCECCCWHRYVRHYIDVVESRVIRSVECI